MNDLLYVVWFTYCGAISSLRPITADMARGHLSNADLLGMGVNSFLAFGATELPVLNNTDENKQKAKVCDAILAGYISKHDFMDVLNDPELPFCDFVGPGGFLGFDTPANAKAFSEMFHTPYHFDERTNGWLSD